MDNLTQEEFEEVESPFIKPKPRPSKLRSKKSHFNRPFAADPTIAPAVFEKKKQRSLGFQDKTDFTDVRESKISDSSIDYLEDENHDEDQLESVSEEIEETPKPVRRQVNVVKKKIVKKPASKLVKFTWAVIGILTLRLVFMDRGVMDYFVAENNLGKLKNELSNLKKENIDLENEIKRIRFDRGYQKQLAKEHLGVIATDEFLILFAGESLDSSGEMSPTTL